MKQIAAQPLTVEKFAQYGSFVNVLEPCGHCFDGGTHCFYPDKTSMNMSGRMAVAFSPLTVNKPDKMIVSAAEYHTFTGETILPLDDDAVIHVAPPTNREIAPETTEAFIVPKGTLVTLKPAVWHLAPLPVHNPVLHALIVLPERTYANDCTVCEYPEERCVEIVL